MKRVPRARLQKRKLNPQRGVALIVGLIFLIILTLFVLGSLRDVLMQERMSGSFRNQSLAESTTKSLLRNGESLIFDRIIASNGSVEFADFEPFDADEAVPANPNIRSFRTGVGYQAGTFQPQFVSAQFQNTTDNTSTLSTSGSYVIEGPVPVGQKVLLESHTGSSAGTTGKLYVYRITARATGGTDDYVRAAESYYIVSR